MVFCLFSIKDLSVVAFRSSPSHCKSILPRHLQQISSEPSPSDESSMLLLDIREDRSYSGTRQDQHSFPPAIKICAGLSYFPGYLPTPDIKKKRLPAHQTLSQLSQHAVHIVKPQGQTCSRDAIHESASTSGSDLLRHLSAMQGIPSPQVRADLESCAWLLPSLQD